MAELLNALDATSTRPYLIRALYEWCTDNGFTPYVAVAVDDTVRVPREYVKNNEIVLNISFDATSSLQLGNEFIEFKARFAGSAREIMVPITHVLAIYARENGQGMAFPVGAPSESPAGVIQPASKPSGVTLEIEETIRAGMPEIAALASPSLAQVPSEGSESRFMQLVPDSSDTTAGAGDVSDADSTEPPPPPRSRPSLKRIK